MLTGTRFGARFGDLFNDFAGLLFMAGARCDVGLRDDADESVLHVHDRNTPHLVLAHGSKRRLQVVFFATRYQSRVITAPTWVLLASRPSATIVKAKSRSVTIPMSRFVCLPSITGTEPTSSLCINRAALSTVSSGKTARGVCRHELTTLHIHFSFQDYITERLRRKSRACQSANLEV
jgi:hypothetical protein